MSQDIANKYPSHAIIFDYLVSKRTGILIFEPGNRKLFFDSGQLVFASSEMAGEHFADILVASGILSEEQLETAKAASKPGKSLGHQLKAQGFATSQQLAHALKQQITYIVDRAIAQIEGDCQSQEGPLPNKLPKLKIQTLGLIIKSIFKMDSGIFQFPVQLDQALFKTAVGDLHLSKIAIPPSYLELFNFLRENVMFSPGTLQEIAKLDGSQLKKMIYILHQLGIIAFKDEVAAIQEPLADLTNDEDTFQDDTMGEDALATVLPPTTPPKTDPRGHLDPARAARAINLPNFAQGGETTGGPPTLRVQDPRAGIPVELDETVRQYDPLKSRPGGGFRFDEEDQFNSLDDEPGFEDEPSFEKDLSTLSRELDPEELEPLPDSIAESEDDLPSIQARQDLLFSEDAEQDGEQEEDFDTAETDAQPLLDSLDPLADFPEEDDGISNEKLVLDSTNPTTDTSFLDTEPALPINDLRNSLGNPTSDSETSSHQTNPEFSSDPAGDTTKRVIMPTTEEDPYFYDRKKPAKKRSSIKLVLAVLLLGVLGLVGFRLYQNYKIANLTDEYLGSEGSDSQLAGDSDSLTGTPEQTKPAAAENSESALDGEPNLDETRSAENIGDESATTLQEFESASELTPPEPDPETAPQPVAVTKDEPKRQDTTESSPAETFNESPAPSNPIQSNTDSRFAEELKSSRERFLARGGTHSLVIMVACHEETVVEALSKYQDQDLFLFPRKVDGKDCWMLTWGAFGSYRESTSNRDSFPQELRQKNDVIWTVKPDL